jgi:hypothetical protein
MSIEDLKFTVTNMLQFKSLTEEEQAQVMRKIQEAHDSGVKVTKDEVSFLLRTKGLGVGYKAIQMGDRSNKATL